MHDRAVVRPALTAVAAVLGLTLAQGCSMQAALAPSGVHTGGPSANFMLQNHTYEWEASHSIQAIRGIHGAAVFTVGNTAYVGIEQGPQTKPPAPPPGHMLRTDRQAGQSTGAPLYAQGMLPTHRRGAPQRRMPLAPQPIVGTQAISPALSATIRKEVRKAVPHIHDVLIVSDPHALNVMLSLKMHAQSGPGVDAQAFDDFVRRTWHVSHTPGPAVQEYPDFARARESSPSPGPNGHPAVRFPFGAQRGP